MAEGAIQTAIDARQENLEREVLDALRRVLDLAEEWLRRELEDE